MQIGVSCYVFILREGGFQGVKTKVTYSCYMVKKVLMLGKKVISSCHHEIPLKQFIILGYQNKTCNLVKEIPIYMSHQIPFYLNYCKKTIKKFKNGF